tara:strand:- start:207 stop:479 length:273 start_codon:yes stop_codon:yes gene_type:complete
MIKWRSIKEVGTPKDTSIDYLVSDGIDIEISGISGITRYKGGSGEKPTFTFESWSGSESTYEDNSCCSGTKVFDFSPTHWSPTTELNLPK